MPVGQRLLVNFQLLHSVDLGGIVGQVGLAGGLPHGGQPGRVAEQFPHDLG